MGLDTKIEGAGELPRIFIRESDHWRGRPLRETILVAAREQGLAGCSVVRGTVGFGAKSHVHTVKILRLSETPNRDQNRRLGRPHLPPQRRRRGVELRAVTSWKTRRAD